MKRKNLFLKNILIFPITGWQNTGDLQLIVGSKTDKFHTVLRSRKINSGTVQDLRFPQH
jgi:hypothetical protein